MKYIYSIVAIFLLLSAVMWVVSSSNSGEPPDKNALVINDRVISFAELSLMWQQKPYHYRDQKEFIDDLVLREILIQEAIAAGIADEDQFKQLIQDFFEQSLVKTLLDRKQLQQKIEVSAQMLDLFRAARQSRYQLALVRYPSYKEAIAELKGQPQTLSDDFVVFPAAVQIRLLSLQPGELSAPFADGSEFVRMRVEQREPLAQLQESTETDEELRQQLEYLLQQQQLEEWIMQVRQQAVVHYPQQQLKKGDN